jgi:hypothetical protein
MASVDTDTGEFQEKRLAHREEAENFYRALAGKKVGVGMEASGHARWFERWLSELQFELWIGDAAEIRSQRVRKQKTDRQDARLILQWLREDRFPQIWVPSWENRDLRQLLWHRHRMVQARTRIMNQLQAVALNEGLRSKRRLWRKRGRQQLESLPVGSLGEQATTRSAGVAGSTQPDHRGTYSGDRARSGEVSASTAVKNSSRSGCADRVGVRADHRGKRIGFTAASKWPAIWDWCLWKTPAASPSRAVRYCVSCWWKQPRSQCAACRNGAVSTFTWRCGGDGRWPRSRWRGNSPFASTGCGARDGIMSS